MQITKARRDRIAGYTYDLVRIGATYRIDVDGFRFSNTYTGEIEGDPSNKLASTTIVKQKAGFVDLSVAPGTRVFNAERERQIKEIAPLIMLQTMIAGEVLTFKFSDYPALFMTESILQNKENWKSFKSYIGNVLRTKIGLEMVDYHMDIKGWTIKIRMRKTGRPDDAPARWNGIVGEGDNAAPEAA